MTQVLRQVDDLRQVTARVIDGSPAEQTEVILTESDSSLTRFANSEIHQNVAEHGVSVRVRVVADGRVGVASTNQVDDASLKEVLARAVESARHQPRRDDVPPLAPPAEVAPAAVDEATATAGPRERAALVAEICGRADSRSVKAFGAISTGVTRYVVANSRGLFMQTPRAMATATVVAMAEGGKGYGDRASGRLADLDAAGAGDEAIDRALRTRDAEPIEPGVYPTVLQESAVASLLEYSAYIGFSALAVEEGRTFMRPGERITGENIHVWDDGHDPRGLPMPFDFEGVPRRRVDLISAGVATGLVHDLSSAARAGVASTGHGLPAPNPYGAYATNLFMAGGEAESVDALCEGIERGVWVTRFWYVNVVHPRQGSLTGMSREGTFLIENGRVTRPIKDMRFTQSVPEALGTVTAMTRDLKLEVGEDYDYSAAYVVPAIRVEKFNWTSVTR